MQSDKHTQMGKYEFSILLREGKSLLLFAEMASTASQTRASALRIYEQTMNKDKITYDFAKIFTK